MALRPWSVTAARNMPKISASDSTNGRTGILRPAFVIRNDSGRANQPNARFLLLNQNLATLKLSINRHLFIGAVGLEGWSDAIIWMVFALVSHQISAAPNLGILPCQSFMVICHDASLQVWITMSPQATLILAKIRIIFVQKYVWFWGSNQQPAFATLSVGEALHFAFLCRIWKNQNMNTWNQKPLYLCALQLMKRNVNVTKILHSS